MGFLIKDSCGITRLSVETDLLPWHHGRLPFLVTATVSTTHNPRPVTRILPILRNYIHLPTAKKNKNIQKEYPKKSVCITLHLIILNLYSHSPKISPIFRASLWSFSTQISLETRHGLSMPASGAPFPRPLLARPVWCCPIVGPRRPSPRLARQGFRHTPKDDDEEEENEEKNWGWGWGSLYFTHISLYRNISH